MDDERAGAIVVGVDETALACHAVRWAAEQAHLEGRPVLLVNVSSRVVDPHSGGAGLPRALVSVGDRGEDVLERARVVIGRHAPDARIAELAWVSDPRTLLLDLSAGARLIVLGARSQGSTLSDLLGSVGLSVVRHSFCPVIVHRPWDHTHRAVSRRLRTGVVAAADATEESLPVLDFAFGQASLRGQPLRIVHYVYDTRAVLVGAPRETDLTSLLSDSERVLAEALALLQQRYPDVRMSVDTVPGTPNHDLTQESARADLLVIGSHQRGVVGRLLLGSVSQTVLAHATCPVAVVPVTPPEL